jgi:hypothetical protein
MIVAVCDMQSEDAAAQSVLSKNLNTVMAKHGILESKFKGFMANSTQANWNTIRVIYGKGDVTIPMKDQERTYFFQGIQSLEKHTKALFVLTSKTNTGNSIGSTRMQLHLLNPRLLTLPFEYGGFPLELLQSMD